MSDPNPVIVEANHLVNDALHESNVDASNAMLEQAATLYEQAGLPDEAADARDLEK